MQDFADDNEAAAQGAHRYQTHVTIVDADQAGPRQPIGSTMGR